MKGIADNATSGLANADHGHNLQNNMLRLDNMMWIGGGSKTGNNQFINIEGSGAVNGGYISVEGFVRWLIGRIRVADTYVR